MNEAGSVSELERDLKMLLGITMTSSVSHTNNPTTTSNADLLLESKPQSVTDKSAPSANGTSSVVDKASSAQLLKPVQAKKKRKPKPSSTKNEDVGEKPETVGNSDSHNQPAKLKEEKHKKSREMKGAQEDRNVTVPRGPNHKEEDIVQVPKQKPVIEKVSKSLNRPSSGGLATNLENSKVQQAKMQVNKSKAGDFVDRQKPPALRVPVLLPQPESQPVKAVDNREKAFKKEKKAPKVFTEEKKPLSPQENSAKQEGGVKLRRRMEKIAIKFTGKPLSDETISQSESERPKSAEVKTVVTSAETLSEAPPTNLEANYTGPDGEDWVRVIVLPPKKPSPVAEKKIKPRSDSEKAEAEDDDSESDSNCSSSTSSNKEEEKKEKPPQTNNQQQQIDQQPLVLNIRKKELDSFRQRGVLPLRHISPKFTRAIFHCRLCSFHISSVPEVYRHMKDERHSRLQAQEQSRQTAILMPLPPPDIMDLVGNLIQDVSLYSRLMPNELEVRRTCTDILRQLVEVSFPGITIRPYGSCFTGETIIIITIVDFDCI